jgi:hypothetical protein
MQYNTISAWDDACFVVCQSFFSQTHEEKIALSYLVKVITLFNGGAGYA